VHGRLEVEFQNGSQTSFPSHLFSALDIRALATPALEIEEWSRLDLFHGRFATDPDWNPAEAMPDSNFIHALRVLERRFRRNPTFIAITPRISCSSRVRNAVQAALDRCQALLAAHQLENVRSTALRKRVRRASVV
jgi:hypothetical protein